MVTYECGDGWRNLIDEAIIQIKAASPGTRITQVKEKLGGLRIYVDHATPKAREIIKITEQIALTSCEECGAHARLQRIGYIYKTLCPVHVKELKHK